MNILNNFYDYLLLSMLLLAIIIFIILQFITPAYGMTFNSRWGVSVNSKVGWIIMESPVFISMTILYLCSMYFEIKPFNVTTLIIFIFFQVHYLERSFIFPYLMKSKSMMPISIIAMGFVFNTINAVMQGGWLFYFSPDSYYPTAYLCSLPFVAGSIIFIIGITINIHSDNIIRQLRKNKDDTNYYIPYGGLFKYSNSANYFGEIIEWIGFAVLSSSISGWIFVAWTMANIIPRANAVYEKYSQFFGNDFIKLKRYKLFPFIY